MPVTAHGLLRKWAGSRPGAAALADDLGVLTWEQWMRAAAHLAAALERSGVRKGDSVAVFCRKGVELPVAFTAVSMLGGRFLSADPAWLDTHSSRILGILGRCRVLAMVEPGAAWSSCPTISVTRQELLSGGDSPAAEPSGDPALEVYLNVTSASTGPPKIVPTPHSRLFANTSGICSLLGLDADDVHMSLFSSTGHPHELFARGLLLGGVSVLTESRYPGEALSIISRHGVTILMGLPPQLEGIARVCGRGDADISTLRIVEAGGMHFSSEFAGLFRSLTGLDATPVWGSTETSGVVLVGDAGREGFTRVVDGYSIEIRDEGGAVITGEGEGELMVSGTGVVGRYLGERSASDDSFRDGWFSTGDIFRRTPAGLEFRGRRGGLIKSAGQKVFPLEVELALLRHPDVAEAVVAGEDHPSRGETVAAWIVQRPGGSLTPASIRRFLRDFLEEHKIPRNFHMVPQLPRTAAGKIDRSALGKPPCAPDWRGELLRTDVELVRLLNHRAEVARRTGAGYDATWHEEQLENAAGHNPGPLSDGAVRDILTFVMDMLARR